MISRTDAFLFVMSVDREIAEALGEEPLVAEIAKSESRRAVTIAVKDSTTGRYEMRAPRGGSLREKGLRDSARIVKKRRSGKTLADGDAFRAFVDEQEVVYVPIDSFEDAAVTTHPGGDWSTIDLNEAVIASVETSDSELYALRQALQRANVTRAEGRRTTKRPLTRSDYMAVYYDSVSEPDSKPEGREESGSVSDPP